VLTNVPRRKPIMTVEKLPRKEPVFFYLVGKVCELAEKITTRRLTYENMSY